MISRHRSTEELRKSWAEDERWRGIQRPYTPEDVEAGLKARLAADVLDVPTLVIARTDANGAFLLTTAESQF